MMNFKSNTASVAIAAFLGVIPAAIGSAPQRVGSYDFTYMTSGERRATPVQTFDDGKSTFFQFRAGESIPAIFSDKGGTVNLVVPTIEGPYVRVPEVAGRFILQLGRAQAQVVYAGLDRMNTPPITAISASGISTPYRPSGYPADPNVKLVASIAPSMGFLNADAAEANSYATPVKGDRVSWQEPEIKKTEYQVWFAKGSHVLSSDALKRLTALTAGLKAATRITVVGRDDETFKEGLELARANSIRSALVKANVEAEKIVVKTGVQSEPVKGLWASDIRVETAVPNLITRPSDTTTAAATQRGDYLRTNVEELVKAGVLNREQANAIIRKTKDRPGSSEHVQMASSDRYPDAPPEGFDLKASDRTVSQTMRRWGSATNYQIVWDAPSVSDAPITGYGLIPVGTMKEALERVVSGLQSKGYDIQATLYSNRVIRFTGINK